VRPIKNESGHVMERDFALCGSCQHFELLKSEKETSTYENRQGSCTYPILLPSWILEPLIQSLGAVNTVYEADGLMCEVYESRE